MPLNISAEQILHIAICSLSEVCLDIHTADLLIPYPCCVHEIDVDTVKTHHQRSAN